MSEGDAAVGLLLNRCNALMCLLKYVNRHCDILEPTKQRHCGARLFSGVLYSRLTLHHPVVLCLHGGNNAVVRAQVTRSSRSPRDGLPTKPKEQ